MSENSTDPKKAYSLANLAAALSGEEPWSWHSRYHPALKDHMHALGVAAANFNHLEFMMQALFWHYTGLDTAVSMHLFADLTNNQKRLDNLKRFVASKETDSIVRDHLYWFIRGFDVCADNRNFLMHGMTLDAYNSTELVMKKFARKDPTKTNYMHLTVPAIRQIADEVFAFDNYGLNLYLWISARLSGGKYRFPDGSEHTPSLPEKPPIPNKMSLSDHPIHAHAFPQPQSSEG